MAKQSRFLPRLLFFVTLILLTAGTAYGLYNINQSMEVRYQAVGKVTNDAGTPLEGVEAVLTLTPPPSSPAALDGLFQEEAIAYGRMDKEGHLKRPVGPVIGLSGANGGIVVRATGRLGAAHAIRLGMDSSGKPPFEIAWIVLRKEGYQDVTVTMPVMGWRTAPKDWGRVANRLPRLKMVEHK